MRRFFAHAYVDAARMLAQMSMGRPAGRERAETLTSDEQDIQRKNAEDLARDFGRMGLPMCRKAAERMVESCSSAQALRYADYQVECRNIVRLMHDELEEMLAFRLNPDTEAYYLDSTFGSDVARAFPSATRDIEEAAKCYATDRWTATVFHLMRAMEHGMDALASYADIENTYRTWDKKILRLSETFVEELRKPYGQSRFAGRLEYFKQVTERLTAVQHALRNETMHARSFYDYEQTTDIYRSVRAFLQHLAINVTEDQQSSGRGPSN